MRFSRSVLIEALAYTLYKWLGVQGICLASQTVVLPCCFSTALILFPICTSLTFDIIKAWNLFLAWVQGIPRPTYLTSHSTPYQVRHFITNLDRVVLPKRRTGGILEPKDSYKRYLSICLVMLFLLFYMYAIICCCIRVQKYEIIFLIHWVTSS